MTASVPKKLRGTPRSFGKFKQAMQNFHDCLFDKDAPVTARVHPVTGVGLFVWSDLKAGSQIPLFGMLHRSSHAQVVSLDKIGDPNVIRLEQAARSGGKRTQWFYVSGTASLLESQLQTFQRSISA